MMSAADFVKPLTFAGLIAVMLAMGLKVTVGEVTAAMGKPRLVFLGIAANFGLVPAVTLGLLSVFGADPMVSVGFLLLAICPGAPVGPPFAAIARGDVACAVGQMVILASLSALVSPVLLGVLAGPLLPANGLRIDSWAIIRTLLVGQIAPLAAGLAFHHAQPKFSEKIAKPVGLIANLLLLAAIGLVLAGEYESLTLIRLRGWFGMLLLLAASLGIGWLCGGPEERTRKSMSLTTAARNAAVALAIVSSNFAGTPAVTAVVAFSLVSIFGSLGCALLLGATGRKKSDAAPATPSAEGGV